MSFLEFPDATAVAEAIKAGRLTPREAVQESLDTIAQYNDALNAVVYVRDTEALAEAEALTDLSAPFAGVPILLKDLHQKNGVPSTNGAKLLAGQISDVTDNYVADLERLGFIVVGTTNMPEFGYKNQSDSVYLGDVHHPLDLTRTPGGSSGGAAAAVVSGMVPFASASDGGGSIRIPASYTGLVGLKPTRGRTAVGPSSWRGWGGASISFGLTRSMRDTESLLKLLQTEQEAAPFHATPIPEQAFATADAEMPALRIAYSTFNPYRIPATDLSEHIVNETVETLRAAGFHLTEANPDVDLTTLYDSYVEMNGFETAAMFDRMQRSFGRTFTAEDMEPFSWAIYQYGLGLPGYRYTEGLDLWDQAAARMADFFSQYDLYIQPSTGIAAPTIEWAHEPDELKERMAHYETLDTATKQQTIHDMFAVSQQNTSFNWPYNLTGQPAISLPLGKAENGLPIGVQVSAPKGREPWLLAIGRYFESRGLFYQPTGVNL